MKNSLFSLILLLLVSCEKEYKFWDIQKFHFKKDALKDNEEIKLIYASNGPDLNPKKEYYYHLIVVSQETGDTINVLTTTQNGFNKDSGDEIFTFLSEDNIASMIVNKKIDINTLNGKNITEIQGEKTTKINKVARDIEYDNIAENNYPTVIGTIGKTTDN